MPGRGYSLLERERRRVHAALGAALLAVAAPTALVSCRESLGRDDTDASVAGGASDGGASVDAAPDCVGVPIPASGCGGRFVPDARYVDERADAEICPLDFPCGLPSSYQIAGCEVINNDGTPYGCRIAGDGGGCVDGRFAPQACGSVMVDCRCDLFPGGGRRTRAPRSRSGRSSRDAPHSFFARMADEEAASVEAFRRLRDELVWHAAPAALVREAERSQRDEVRHARTIARIAGVRASVVMPRSRRPRDLESIARENEVEGCVRETYGALLARWQATRAHDPTTRIALGRIAHDEARHAALAWAVKRWARERLDAPAIARLARARRRAVRALERELGARVPHDVVRDAGVPTAAQARALLAAITRLIASD